MACAKSPARRCGVSCPASARMRGLAAGSSSSTANSRAITRSILPSTGLARLVERDRRDRGRRVGADAGERAQRLLGAGKSSAVLLDHGLGAGMQVAGARVVAEPGPELEHVVERRGGKLRDRRKAREEARIIRSDRLHGGLLQHDLGEPDPIGIGALAVRARATAARGGGGRTSAADRRVDGRSGGARPSCAAPSLLGSSPPI